MLGVTLKWISLQLVIIKSLHQQNGGSASRIVTNKLQQTTMPKETTKQFLQFKQFNGN